MDQTATCHLQEAVTQKLNTSKITFFPDICPSLGLPVSGRGVSSIYPAAYVRTPKVPTGNLHPLPTHIWLPSAADSTWKCHTNSSSSFFLTTAALSRHCSRLPRYSGVSSHSSTEPGWPPSSMFASHPRSRMTPWTQKSDYVIPQHNTDVHCCEESFEDKPSWTHRPRVFKPQPHSQSCFAWLLSLTHIPPLSPSQLCQHLLEILSAW